MTAAPHSPFPGMDPYLEGWLWPDVHHSLASAIRDQLANTIRPEYTVRIETRLVEDDHPEQELGIMYPDVHVRVAEKRPPASDPDGGGGVATLTGSLNLPLVAPTTIRVPVIRIRLLGNQTLVASIEILSPIKKRGAALEKFRDKWRQLHRAGVHLVEVDLIRRGQRIFQHVELKHTLYLATVTRAGRASTEAWPIGLRDRLPRIPVPLLVDDPDGVIDLQAALDYVFGMGRYTNNLDYAGAPPPPPLSAEDAAWARDRIDAWRAARA